MAIPVERIGSEREKIPAVLIKIEKSVGFIKYGCNLPAVKVALSELQLAPSALEPGADVFSHTKVGSAPWLALNRANECHFRRRTNVEVWLPTEATRWTMMSVSEMLDDITKPNAVDTSIKVKKDAPTPRGAWWPGRIVDVRGEFASVEVAAPAGENFVVDDMTTIGPDQLRMGSALFPYRSARAKLDEIRLPWNGSPHPTVPSSSSSSSATEQDAPHQPMLLSTPNGVLQRHTICIPAYLARLATCTDSHSALVKFCGAPCLIQCDPEPFLANVMAKRIRSETDSVTNSGRQTPNAAVGSELDSLVPSVIDSKSNSSYPASSFWPPAHVIVQSTLLSVPTIAGTLSSFGVTDPALLLEGLPGASGPLVFLHIWSGSREAIRRATLLELAHVRILVFRYHVMRKMSNGELGELELSDSIDSPTENGDAPAMHCKPISIPIHPNAGDHESDIFTPNEHDVGGMMIGYSAQFRIQPHLIGLAIGYRGSTIQEARTLLGVRVVDLLQDGIIHVEAETVEACQAVRNLLDFTEAEIPVSSRLASRLIGSKGLNIRKLATSAGVRRAQLLDPLMRKRRQQQRELMKQRQKQQQNAHFASTSLDIVNLDTVGSSEELDEMRDKGGDNHSPVDDVQVQNKSESTSPEDEKLPSPAFYLLGTRASVSKMRLLLEFQADNWNELDELEETRRSLCTQLRQSNQPIMNKSVPVVNGGDTCATDGVLSSEAPPRRPTGRGAASNMVPDMPRAPANQGQQHQPPYRPRNRGGMSNGGGRAFNGPQRSNHTSESMSTNGDQLPNTAPVPSTSQQNAPTANGWKPHFGPRGRGGRFMPRNPPVPVSNTSG